ncbi:MAG: gamma carbonic anhydrase family protein [Candidatus Eremiobacterota bacterium]
MLIELDGQAPELAADVYVAPTAVLIGRVRAAEGCSFWFHSVVRGDNEWLTFGEGTNLQDHCMCHADDGFPLTVGARCTIGHHAVLHGCTLEDDVLIGIGARVLNGAVVERGALVAAGALVTEGARVQAGWLYMGAPARPVRELKPEELERMRFGAEHYRNNGARYRAGARGLGR